MLQDGNIIPRVINWSGVIEISTFAFSISGGLIGESTVRFLETDAYSSGPISIPREGVITAGDVLPLIMLKYNEKLRIYNVE